VLHQMIKGPQQCAGSPCTRIYKQCKKQSDACLASVICGQSLPAARRLTLHQDVAVCEQLQRLER
jgi:hypothetical protein